MARLKLKRSTQLYSVAVRQEQRSGLTLKLRERYVTVYKGKRSFMRLKSGAEFCILGIRRLQTVVKV